MRGRAGAVACTAVLAVCFMAFFGALRQKGLEAMEAAGMWDTPPKVRTEGTREYGWESGSGEEEVGEAEHRPQIPF